MKLLLLIIKMLLFFIIIILFLFLLSVSGLNVILVSLLTLTFSDSLLTKHRPACAGFQILTDCRIFMSIHI